MEKLNAWEGLHMCPHLLIRTQKLVSPPKTSQSHTTLTSQLAFTSQISLKTKSKSSPIL
ncbi:hypothetical protein GBA52_004215, partial [Prunus armeniaca]